MNFSRLAPVPVAAISLLAALPAAAQDGNLMLRDWKPVSQMVVKKTEVLRPKFPVIDFHNHLREMDKLEEYVAIWEETGVVGCVSLEARSKDNGWKDYLSEINRRTKGMVYCFFVPDFESIDTPDFGRKEAAKLEEAVRAGCRGVKVFKELGLVHKDKSGKLVPIDDPRLDPIWAKCGELGIPVMIHSSDPKAFFTPIDEYNERYDELGTHPHWAFFDSSKYPSKAELLRQRNHMISKHPGTTYVCAHIATLPEELGTVSMWLQTYPNMYLDFSARISELGRQPYTARKFFIEHQDRILFGTDVAPYAPTYRVYYRWLETDDEYIDPNVGHHMQGRWAIYGLYLPDEVLAKIYNGNALKILNAIKRPQ